MRTQLGKHTLHKCMGAFQKQKTKTNANTKHIFIYYLKKKGGGGGGKGNTDPCSQRKSEFF